MTVDRPLRILHIIKGLGRGGAERLLPETIAAHNGRFHFDVVYFLPWKNQLVGDLESLGCSVHLLPASGAVGMMRQVAPLRRLIRDGAYDLVHCHLPWAGIVGRRAARLEGVPAVYTEHNNYFSYNPLTRLAHRLGISSFQKIIAVSDDAAAALKKARVAGNVSLVLNGVNTATFDRDNYDTAALRKELNIPADTRVITTVAVFRKQKRLDRWLAIAKGIIETRAAAHFLVIGDGPMKEELLAITRSQGLVKYVTFTGLVSDPRPYLAVTDIYLMSSDFEGLPVALLEAMSMKACPVATPVGGIPGLVVHGGNGVLYEPTAPEAAVDEVAKLIENPARLKLMQDNARATVRTGYSVERMVSRLEEIYSTLTQS